MTATAPLGAELILLLGPDDNVMVARQALPAGHAVTLSGVVVSLPQAVARGHKIACRVIRTGEKIVKYGAPIGSATRDIAPGEHVHVHNVKSDYTQTHLIEKRAE